MHLRRTENERGSKLPHRLDYASAKSVCACDYVPPVHPSSQGSSNSKDTASASALPEAGRWAPPPVWGSGKAVPTSSSATAPRTSPRTLAPRPRAPWIALSSSCVSRQQICSPRSVDSTWALPDLAPGRPTEFWCPCSREPRPTPGLGFTALRGVRATCG